MARSSFIAVIAKSDQLDVVFKEANLEVQRGCCEVTLGGEVSEDFHGQTDIPLLLIEVRFSF